MSEESELQLMSGKSLERTKQRSDIAKKQKLLIDELVDLRVKMQSILVLVNKLPQGTLRNEFVNKNESVKNKTSEIVKDLSEATHKMIHMDFSLSEKIPECYHPKVSVKRMRQVESSLEEKDGNHYYGCVKAMTEAKRDWEVATLEHWNKRVQIQSGKTLKLNTLNKSIFEQVDSVLEDDVRWHKRCTVMRGDYDIIGEETIVDEDGQRRNDSIYDDQEFYNSLLNQYAALSMSTGASVIRQRNSKKKEIQRKASKGRRLIYTVHPKLQNFCAPEKYPTPTVDITQLFSSLFGKTTK